MSSCSAADDLDAVVGRHRAVGTDSVGLQGQAAGPYFRATAARRCTERQPFSTDAACVGQAAGRLAEPVPAALQPLEGVLDDVLGGSDIADHDGGQPHEFQPVLPEQVLHGNGLLAAARSGSGICLGQAADLGGLARQGVIHARETPARGPDASPACRFSPRALPLCLVRTL